MLRNINSGIEQSTSMPLIPSQPSRYSRNEKDDIKTAIDALYEFKRKLDELHPTATDLIENMLQRPRFN